MPISASALVDGHPASGTCCRAVSNLRAQAVDVVDVVVRPLAVLPLLVVPRAAREVRRHAAARDACDTGCRRRRRPCSGPTRRCRFSVSASSTLPRSSGSSGYANGSDIHVFIARSRSLITKTRRLEALGEVEGVHRHRVALLDRCRDQHDLLGVAVRQQRRAEDVALRGARRQAGRRPDALDVENHARDFRVVGEAGELAHQRDAGPGGRRHRARARPAGADDHADARRSRPRPGRSRRSPCRRPCRCGTSSCNSISVSGSDDDGVIGYQAHDGDAGHHAAERRGRVALDEDHARASCPSRSIAVRILLGEVRARRRPSPPRARRGSARSPWASCRAACAAPAPSRRDRCRAASRARRRKSCS